MANFTVSSAVDTMMQSSDAAGIRSSIGVVDGVTSVSLTDGTGIASSGSPVTSSGSITVGLNAATHSHTLVLLVELLILLFQLT
mgnify:CR=1 FL=1